MYIYHPGLGPGGPTYVSTTNQPRRARLNRQYQNQTSPPRAPSPHDVHDVRASSLGVSDIPCARVSTSQRHSYARPPAASHENYFDLKKKLKKNTFDFQKKNPA
jgi:hypothetical protein